MSPVTAQVSLFSENSSRWIVADQGIMMNGAADAVRGAASPAEELAYIMSQSDSSALVVQDAATLAKLLPHLTQVRKPGPTAACMLWPPASSRV
jgi:long-subunit acyl-CoA synthetase (AMP-forming)